MDDQEHIFFLVEADSRGNLAKLGTTPDGVHVSLKTRNGVLTVRRADAVSAETWTRILLPPEQAYHKPKGIGGPRRKRNGTP